MMTQGGQIGPVNMIPYRLLTQVLLARGRRLTEKRGSASRDRAAPNGCRDLRAWRRGSTPNHKILPSHPELNEERWELLRPWHPSITHLFRRRSGSGRRGPGT